jgi:spore coat protein U-like protein
MNVLLTLENGCVVSGSTDPLNAVNFGSMSFGTVPTLFGINLQAQSLISSSPVQLQCSSGANLNILVGSGLNATGGVRRLASSGHYVQYRLFTQSNGGGTEYTQGGSALDLTASVPGGGGTFNLPIYGQIVPQANLFAGSYTDVVSITLTF